MSKESQGHLQDETITLGGFPLDRFNPPVFLAEIGGFFGQDLQLAKEMIERIIACGRDVPDQPMVLKTEILHDPDVCLPGPTMETYASKAGDVAQENYRSLIERKVLPLPHYATLFEICRDAGTPFITSVYDFEGADFAVEQGVSALKIASGNIVHIPLIRHCAKLCADRNLPLLIDTGRASLAEVDRAVTTARASGAAVVVEHSPDGHPALPKAHNLRIMQTYKQAFGCPVGLSDHHTGLEMIYMAVALGAELIEKGVHVAPDDLDIDISHTMDMADLTRVLQSVHDCWLAMGMAHRDRSKQIEGVIGTSQRACLVAARNLAPGDGIDLQTVRFAWPCEGVPVEHWDLVNGWRVVNTVTVGRPITWSDIQRIDD